MGLETTGILRYVCSPYMIVVSLKMSDEPKKELLFLRILQKKYTW